LGHHPIKPHVPLLMSRRAKSIPFLCCQNTPEAECFPLSEVLSLHSVFRVRTIQVSNLFRFPHFSDSMLVFIKEELSRFSILTILIRFNPSFSGSPCRYLDVYFVYEPNLTLSAVETPSLVIWG